MKNRNITDYKQTSNREIVQRDNLLNNKRQMLSFWNPSSAGQSIVNSVGALCDPGIANLSFNSTVPVTAIDALQHFEAG